MVKGKAVKPVPPPLPLNLDNAAFEKRMEAARALLEAAWEIGGDEAEVLRRSATRLGQLSE